MISLITPIYNFNKEKFERLNQSVEDQICRDFEWIIVVDDINTLIPVGMGVPECTVIQLGRNFGPSVARNIGFQASSGDIIAYADMDDILDFERIKHLNDFYTQYPHTKLLFDGYLIRQEQNYYLYEPLIAIHSITNLRALLQKRNISIPLGVSHTRQPFGFVGGFQRGIVCGEDGITWRRMSEILSDLEIKITDLVAGVYTVNPSGQSRTQRRFDMGGFAFDANNKKGSNGQYLDTDWFNTFSSKNYFDKPLTEYDD
jgi:glycosyltransferase involved in cell wall biosynthesis